MMLHIISKLIGKSKTYDWEAVDRVPRWAERALFNHKRLDGWTEVRGRHYAYRLYNRTRGQGLYDESYKRKRLH